MVSLYIQKSTYKQGVGFHYSFLSSKRINTQRVSIKLEMYRSSWETKPSNVVIYKIQSNFMNISAFKFSPIKYSLEKIPWKSGIVICITLIVSGIFFYRIDFHYTMALLVTIKTGCLLFAIILSFLFNIILSFHLFLILMTI